MLLGDMLTYILLVLVQMMTIKCDDKSSDLYQQNTTKLLADFKNTAIKYPSESINILSNSTYEKYKSGNVANKYDLIWLEFNGVYFNFKDGFVLKSFERNLEVQLTDECLEVMGWKDAQDIPVITLEEAIGKWEVIGQGSTYIEGEELVSKYLEVRRNRIARVTEANSTGLGKRFGITCEYENSQTCANANNCDYLDDSNTIRYFDCHCSNYVCKTVSQGMVPNGVWRGHGGSF